MRFWGPNIQISGEWIMYSPSPNDDNARRNPGAAQYEESTQNILRDISRNVAGRTVLDAFTRSSRSVTIRPLTAGAAEKAQSGAIFPEKAHETDIGSPSQPGPGSDSTIWFNPGSISILGHLYRADDTLLHESIHSLRQVRGRWRADFLAGWDNREELYATMLTNIYASSSGRNADMRGNHAKNFVPMQMTDSQFRQQFNAEITDFRTQMFDVYDRIAAMPTGWNPLRVFESTFWNR
jgi:NleD-like pathogen effector protein (putative zinc metallopeptidase)